MQMSESSSPLFVVTGPTGSGKTAIAMHLADYAAVKLISVDSVMVYKGLNIGSAKPSPNDLMQYPHELVDIVPPDHSFDVKQFVDRATKSITEAWCEKRVPILVGGTIMYLKALLNGLNDLPPADLHIREQIRRHANQYGWQAVHQKLKSLDPNMADCIHPNHSSRIERALEVRLITNQSIQNFWTTPTNPLQIAKRPVDLQILALIPLDRNDLKDRLNKRFDKMLTHGLLEEVIGLRDENPNLSISSSSMRSIGYRQVWGYLNGEFSEQQMTERAKAATRQLAKRQFTWLRTWRPNEILHLTYDNQLPINDALCWFQRVMSDVF